MRNFFIENILSNQFNQQVNHIYVYKMTHDMGFAPNPCHGQLTLATCKPTIRRCAKVGDWIAGWTAKDVHTKSGVKHFAEPKLVYLAKVTEILPLEEYWEKFPQKRPKLLAGGETPKGGCTGSCGNSSDAGATVYDNGDNIYEKLQDGTWVQHPNGDHTEADKERDLSGVNALICDEFCFFGADNALDVPQDVFSYAIPRLKKVSLADEAATRLLAAFAQQKSPAK